MTDSLDIATALLRRDDIEGLRLKPYICPAGYWTIGIGNRFLADGKPVTANTKPITENQAVDLVRQTLTGMRETLRTMVKVPLTPSQEGALLSLQFNIGTGALRSSTLLRVLNQGKYEAAESQFLRWDKATVNGRQTPLPGLQRRRRLESEIFAGREITTTGALS
ncbi:lysozyme [Asaia astilbis]|uniref:lysozyme n=1 Tax=Asaia astilbis TaxID=610244 RepID=UPI00046F1711|nr:lysozyme [Asaia astilbis]